MLSDIYEQNIEYFKKMFKHDSTFILREFKTARPTSSNAPSCCSTEWWTATMLNRSVIEHVMRAQVPSKKNALDYLFSHVASPTKSKPPRTNRTSFSGLCQATRFSSARATAAPW